LLHRLSSDEAQRAAGDLVNGSTAIDGLSGSASGSRILSSAADAPLATRNTLFV
jgi:hypothetical protein